MYKEIFNSLDNVNAKIVLRIADNAFIPMHPDNTDYQAYLAWLSEGNVPEPADEP
tara:strand:+ start:999 stop:1163 length:165 start_codon:yes stop_codon:yes gene_type:complete